MPDPSNAGDRAKAYRLRKDAKRKKLAPVDALWLAEYVERQEKNKKDAGRDGGRSRNFGASRAGRKVSFELEEHAEAVGEGNAAAAAASAVLVAKEEGRRLDALTIESVGALKEAVATYRDVCLTLKQHMEVLENTHVAMLEAHRDSVLQRTEMESAMMELARKTDDEDPTQGLMLMMLAKHLGIPMDGLPGGGMNGHAKPPRKPA